MSQPRRSFTPEFKQEAVDLCRRTGKSECQVARELRASAIHLESLDATRCGRTARGEQFPGDRRAEERAPRT